MYIFLKLFYSLLYLAKFPISYASLKRSHIVPLIIYQDKHFQQNETYLTWMKQAITPWAVMYSSAIISTAVLERAKYKMSDSCSCAAGL